MPGRLSVAGVLFGIIFVFGPGSILAQDVKTTVVTGYDMGVWYANAIDNPYSGDLNELDNICELGTNRKISSLFSFPAAEHFAGFAYTDKLFKAPGFSFANITGTLITEDGGTASVVTGAAIVTRVRSRVQWAILHRCRLRRRGRLSM